MMHNPPRLRARSVLGHFVFSVFCRNVLDDVLHPARTQIFRFVLSCRRSSRFWSPSLFSVEGSPRQEPTSPVPCRTSPHRGHSCRQDGGRLAAVSTCSVPVGEPFESVTIHVYPHRAHSELCSWLRPSTALTAKPHPSGIRCNPHRVCTAS